MPDEIERLLGRMPLHEPSVSMDARVLGQRHRGRRVLWWAAAGSAVGAAAAVLFVFFALSHDGGEMVARDTDPPAPAEKTPPPAIAQSEPPPVRLEQNWSTVAYEGVVVPDQRVPLRKFRRHVLEHIQWIDKAHGRRMDMTIPREQVILIKAPIN